MNFRPLVTAIFFAAGIALAQAPQQQSGPSSFTVGGDVSTPLTLSADDMAKMPREKVFVPDQDGTNIEYEGVPLREIMKRAGAPLGNQLRGKALASYILVKAHDGYQVVFTLGELDSEFANENILVADKRDGKPLFGYQGPFRLVVEKDHAGARSVRMLESIEFIRLQK
ncbi:MAG: molybdopterin-dependent oxidoreductase [Bryobacterales bacterium]|nr:molybdopterin-dependent oxidoreductase [Bryobacterales bacterium]MBV9398984.1 molybdopterin-dependent oxidoreductase [Bryobacterales bacterium]